MKYKFISSLWALTKGYWQSTEKKTAWLYLTSILILNITSIIVLVLLNKWNNRFYGALQEYNNQEIFSALQEFSILATIFVLVAIYSYYLQQSLVIKWREWMTKEYWQEWLDNRNYYLLQLDANYTDNPDQRISEDIKMFVLITLTLAVGFIRSFGILLAFIFILWDLSGLITIPLLDIEISGYLVWVSIIYAVIGTFITHKIGKPLIDLNFQQQKYEADFRYNLVRLRENSESIAFYRGETVEGEIFGGSFTQVIKNYWQLVKKQKQLIGFATVYGQIAIIFPFVVAMPRYLSKTINLGGLMQIASAFGQVQNSLSFFVDAYSQIAEWKAVVERLLTFHNHMQTVREASKNFSIKLEDMPTNDLTITNLNILLPNKKVLLANFNLQVQKGTRLLVKGISGSGKSTLLRTLAGIWPFGEGKIIRPQGQKVLFLPQRTYLPLGSLRTSITYPSNIAYETEEMIAVMKECHIEHLIPYLDKEDSWSRVLSLGEQQRVAFARVFLLKPDWLYLDEATSALDEPMERIIYQLLQEKLPQLTIISVGHRKTLDEFHNQELILR